MTVMTMIRRADFSDDTWERFERNGTVARWRQAGVLDETPGRTPGIGPAWTDAAAVTAAGPTRIVIEIDGDDAAVVPPDVPELDQEVAFQIKFFYDHGYWAGKQMSGGPPWLDMNLVSQLSVPLVTDPEAPTSKVLRDRLESTGLLQ